MPVSDRKCVECGRLYDVLVMGSREVSLTDGFDGTGCPTCGCPQFVKSIVPAQPLPPRAASAVSYPYFDRGLGQVIESGRHRDRVCKALGVVPVDSFDIGRSSASIAVEEAEKHKADLKLYEEHPDFRPWRESRDRMTEEARAEAKADATAHADRVQHGLERAVERALSTGAPVAAVDATTGEEVPDASSTPA